MMTRLLAILAAVVLGAATLAQPPTAPPPQLTLDELVREYRRLGLPLAPPNAELVRVPNSRRPKTGFYLDLRVPSADRFPPFDPRTDSLRELQPEWVADLLRVAAQCYLNGRTEDARILYSLALEGIRNPVPAVYEEVNYSVMFGGPRRERINGWKIWRGFSNHTAYGELREAASQYWYAQVESPDADRREVLHYLKATGGSTVFVQDFSDLELTLAPRTSRPGTAEALIDDLTEYRAEPRGALGWAPGLLFRKPSPPHPGEGAYWKLAEMGFDAVPALIEHINDPRYTRALYAEQGAFGLQSYSLLRVRHLTWELLKGLADHSIVAEDKDWNAGARVWLERARRVGEETWLAAHALPAPGAERDTLYDPPNRVVFRALGAKYPVRLTEVYRTVLRTRPRLESEVLALEVAASRLPHNAKVALLAEGVAHPLPGHQHAALSALARVDKDAFRASLLARLAAFPRVAGKGGPFGITEAAIVGVVDMTDDPACWGALATATRRASVGLRLDVLAQFERISLRDRNPAARPQRLRFLLSFLGDTNGRRGWMQFDDEPTPSAVVQVRDYAAGVLARELGWDIEFKPDRGPEARRVIREAVREATEREIAAPR